MLVGGGVEDDGRAFLLEDRVEPARIADVGDERSHRDVGELLGERAIDLEEVVLRLLDEDDALRLEAADLPA